MFSEQTHVRVRYAETDQMRVVYYGIYTQYFEVGRVEALRELGMTYRSMEENGTMLPVTRLEINYKHPAKYDELLTITSTIANMPTARIAFDHEVHNEEGRLLTTGRVELVFVDARTMRPKKAPHVFLERIAPYFA
jgi:acyl-CoA thioester hydrolase